MSHSTPSLKAVAPWSLWASCHNPHPCPSTCTQLFAILSPASLDGFSLRKHFAPVVTDDVGLRWAFYSQLSHQIANHLWVVEAVFHLSALLDDVSPLIFSGSPSVDCSAVPIHNGPFISWTSFVIRPPPMFHLFDPHFLLGLWALAAVCTSFILPQSSSGATSTPASCRSGVKQLPTSKPNSSGIWATP